MENNFNTLFETISDLIFICDVNGKILFTNISVTKNLGYSSEELKSMYMLDLHHKNNRIEAEEIFSSMFSGERDICPLPLIRKDGTLFPVQTRIWFGEWDKKKCIFGLSKDITAEQESQQKFERLFRNNPALMALSVLPERTFVDVNNSFIDTIGYSKEEIIGVTTNDLNLFPNIEEQKIVANNLEKYGSITNIVLQVCKKNGEILDGIFSGEIINTQGKQYFLTVMIDITDRKKAEKLLLEQSKKLKELNETKDKFLSIIAHDLKSPFTAIIGFSNILSEQIKEKDYNKIDEYAKIIEKSSWKAMNLLSGLMEWATTQSGSMTFNPDYIKLSPIIDEIVELLDDSAIHKSISIKIEGIKNIVIFADTDMISSILRNIISNSIKFTKNGGKIIILTEKINNEIIISIKDNGVGIKKETIEKLFKINESVSTAGTQNESGTGLGLIICKEFIEKHKGKIIVESNVGKGSTFKIILPNFS